MGYPKLTSGRLRVRRFEAGDAAATLRVFREAVRRSAGRDYTRSQVAAWAPSLIDMSAWTRRRLNCSTWVAECDGAVIGFSDLEHDGHIDMLYVHPTHQGRRIASVLLDESERSAREAGMPMLHTEASIAARPVFLRRGFQVVTAQAIDLRGETLTNYRMEKRLGVPAAGMRYVRPSPR